MSIVIQRSVKARQLEADLPAAVLRFTNLSRLAMGRNIRKTVATAILYV